MATKAIKAPRLVHSIGTNAMQYALLELKDVCEFHKDSRNMLPVQSACSAVANLIAGSGVHGSSEQQAMMDLASSVGFSPEYWPDGIRVSYRFQKKGRK